MDLGLADKTALVTGATSGLGRATAQFLAREGASVVVHGRDQTAAAETVDLIASQGGTARAVLGDLRSDAAVARVLAESGAVDVLVNNAGGRGALTKPFFDLSADDWIDQYETELGTAARMIKAFAPGMRDRGWGRIVNFSTGMALRPLDVGAHYAAAKTAILNLTLSAAKALSGTGVTVNAIVPGAIETDSFKALWTQMGEARGVGSSWEDVKPLAMRAVGQNPSGRLGAPDDIAAAVAFLASTQAGFVNGVLLRVDGGAIDNL